MKGVSLEETEQKNINMLNQLKNLTKEDISKVPASPAKGLGFSKWAMSQLYDDSAPVLDDNFALIPSKEFIAASLDVIKKHGFISVTKAKQNHIESSSDKALRLLMTKSPSMDSLQMAEELLTWANAIRTTTEHDEIFSKAVETAVTVSEVDLEHAPYLTFLASSYSECVPSKPMGKVGSFLKKRLTVTDVVPFHKNGISKAGYKFKDDEGNIYMWWASKKMPYYKGATRDCAFRVSGHKTYKGNVETLIHFVMDANRDVETIYRNWKYQNDNR